MLDADKEGVCVNYEREYWKMIDLIKQLTDENGKLKEALLKLALRL